MIHTTTAAATSVHTTTNTGPDAWTTSETGSSLIGSAGAVPAAVAFGIMVASVGEVHVDLAVARPAVLVGAGGVELAARARRHVPPRDAARGEKLGDAPGAALA